MLHVYYEVSLVAVTGICPSPSSSIARFLAPTLIYFVEEEYQGGRKGGVPTLGRRVCTWAAATK